MLFSKKPIACKLDDLGEARSIYIQANALTSKNRTTAVHRGSLVFMGSDLMIEELSMASSGIYELKAVDTLSVLMTFLIILNPDQSYLFQNDSKNIVNKVTSNMGAAFKLELQKQVYASFSLKYLPMQAVLNRKMTHHYN